MVNIQKVKSLETSSIGAPVLSRRWILMQVHGLCSTCKNLYLLEDNDGWDRIYCLQFKKDPKVMRSASSLASFLAQLKEEPGTYFYRWGYWLNITTGTYLGNQVVAEITDVFSEVWIDGQDVMSDLTKLFHHSFIPEIIGEHFCPLTVDNRKGEKLLKKKLNKGTKAETCGPNPH